MGRASQPPSVDLVLAFCGEHYIFLLLNADEPGALPECYLLAEFSHDGVGLEKPGSPDQT